ncbi:TonB-dependent receptor plug domain-containing protein [Pseudemcibacter aquimaris]|uniref:TonB-dependent receptor plug domain-containing protein n=1 Tax=Pseudemcibacter aquimaris TaxID=2857064 RepID=UPI002011E294|nr:TonB-dependent receptor [Pseudemcibacter aquimaris]MCC3862077.1 TonB-dependent receptor plug domain-containing protein [Pseudemcibacter aquimaris]WDU58830.1 TonB-dependent receptor plug domain-containing protein [Pseudemcibacter aquimaris]
MFKPIVKATLLSAVSFYSLNAFAQNADSDQSVVTYGQDYFEKFAPVTLLDMLQRVPGVQAILDANRQTGGTQRGGQQERGFGSGGDQILINNKRLSGKANNINSTLQRISSSQVERVEIIRGASGDLDVQSQGLVVNVIMDESGSSSSTFWKIGGRLSEGYIFTPNVQISHNGSNGNLDYMFGVEAKQGQHIEHRDDTIFTPDDVETGIAERRLDRQNKYVRLNANITYTPENGDEIRLNGQFEPGSLKIREPRFSQTTGEERAFQQWNEDADTQKWEFGGDYTKRIDGIGSWKTLFIANRDRSDKLDLYENIIDGDGVPSFRNDQYRVKSEKIIRTSLTTNIFKDQSLEIGAEAAINKFDKIFVSEDYDLGAYTVSINDDVAVKENRYEIFANHTYNISSSMVLQSSLIGEFSKISSVTVPLVGENIERSKKFSFLKPRVDFRYDFSNSDQLRLTVEKKVSQLDFQNFVASYDQSNDLLRLGNTGIVPEKSWNYNIAYEHRFPNDAGAIQVELFYRDLTDYIELVDFTEFEDELGNPIARGDLDLISKSGNIPTARSYGIKTTGSIRLGFIGLRNAVISVDHTWDDTEVEDQFSGVLRPFKWKSEHEITFNFRHDITDWGISYGGRGTIKTDNSRHELDQVANSYNGDNYEAFLEKRILGDMRLIFQFEHITPLKYATHVDFYNDHIRYNDLNRYEKRNWNYVREWSVYLQGTF